LSIDAEDTFVVSSPNGGYDLFIRKKPDASSVLLTEFTPAVMERRTELYGYRAGTRNNVNGSEKYTEYGSRIFRDGGVWFLVDSTPEPHHFAVDGEEEDVFHIYIPPVLYYGYHDTRSGIAAAEHGLLINLRCFAGLFANIRSDFADNYFVLILDEPGHPYLLPFKIYNPKPTVVEETPPPDPPKEEPPETPIAEPEEETQGEPEPKPPEPEKGEFLLEAEAGILYFTPGSNKYSLMNTTNVPVRIFFKAPFFERLSLNIGYEWELVLLNRIFARAAFDFGVISIEAGLAMGLFNFDTSDMSLALSTKISAQSPGGRIFGSLALDFPFDGAQKDSTFPYQQTNFVINAGFKPPYMVISIKSVLSVMLLRDEKELYDVSYITSQQSLYSLTVKTDFAKLFDFSLTAGYRDLNRSVRALFLMDPYKYTSFFAGLGFFMNVNQNFGLFMNTEVPFYPWVFNPLPLPSDAFFFTASLGLTLRFGGR
jgi:hypothetical protein